MNDGAPDRDDRRWTRAAFALLGILALFRLWFVGRIELQGDEAYYWLWSRHLDYSYYSKGPGIAWIIRLGTALAGDTESGVRWPAVAFAFGGGALVFAIARRLFDARIAFAAVLVAVTVPLSWAGGLLMTIDPPSVFFWLLAAYAFLRALESDRRRWWLGAGGAMALGALCKFTALAQLVSFAAILASTPDGRRRLAGARFRAMVAVALAGLLPPVLWNAGHGWVTFRHLAERGALDQPFRADVLKMLEFVAGQALALSPFYAAALAWAAFRGGRRGGPRAPAFRFLAWQIAPLPLFYAVVSLNGKSEPNWTAPALALAPVWLAAAGMAALDARRGLRRGALALVALHAVLAVAAHAALLTPAIYGEPPRFRRIGGARSLAARAAESLADTGADAVIGGNYQTAALLSFYLPDRPRTYVPLGPRATNQFYFWPSYRDLAPGATVLYVGDQPPRPELLAEFESADPLEGFHSEQYGRPLRRFHRVLLRRRRAPTAADRVEPAGSSGSPTP